MECGDILRNDIEIPPNNQNAHILVRKLVTLMGEPISATMTDRHLLLLDDLLEALQFGVFLQDIPYVTQLIDLLLQKSETHIEFKCYLSKFIRLLSTPPMLRRSNEILRNKIDLIEYFSFIGYLLLKTKNTTIRNLIVQSLWSTLQKHKRNTIYCIPLNICQDAISKSELPAILGGLIEAVDGDFYIEVVVIANEVAKLSPENCFEFLKLDVLQNLMIKLNPSWKEDEIIGYSQHNNVGKNQPCCLQESLQLISVLLTAYPKMPDNISKNLRTIDVGCLWGIRYVFRHFTLKANKIDRNFTMSLLLQLFEYFPSCLYLYSGIILDVCTLAVGTENGLSETWASFVHFNIDSGDYEFKKMLLIAVVYCNDFFGSKQIFEDAKVVRGILRIVSSQKTNQWPPNYLSGLRVIALNTLERILSAHVDTFLEEDGMKIIYNLILYYNNKQFSKDILVAAVKCMHQVLTFIKDIEMQKCFVEKVVMLLQDIVGDIIDKQNLTSSNQTVLTYIFSIFAIAIKRTKIKFREPGVLGLKYLNRCLKPVNGDMLYDSWLMVNVLNILWKLILLDINFCEFFIKSKGVYSVLDIIKDAVYPVKLIGLSLLVDTAEEETALPFLVSWRKEGKNLIQVLLEIFREDNANIGVKISEEGVLEDLKFPLMGAIQEEMMNTTSLTLDDSLSITDMDLSCRPKIYALTQLLFERHEHNFSIANDYYRVFNCNLSTREKIDKILLDNFLALKIGEAWFEVKQNLQKSAMKVVPIDDVLMTGVLSNYEKWKCTVQNLQMNCANIANKNEYLTEEEYYNLLRESKLEKALEALKSIKFIARTTKFCFRHMFKIEETHNFGECLNCHRTYNTELGTTCSEKQCIKLQSDIIIDLNSKDVVPNLVSPINSLVSFEINSVRGSEEI